MNKINNEKNEVIDNTNKLKTCLFVFFIFFIFILIVEIGCRVALSLYFNSSSPLKLGFSSKTALESPQALVKTANRSKDKAESHGFRGEIWTFGGSTTYGKHCGQSSSWPEILDSLIDGYHVKNFAVNGQNSDYSIRKLESQLKRVAFDDQVVIPKIVLWANRANETDVLSFGLDKNISNILNVDDSSFHIFIARVIHFNSAFVLSMQQYSAIFVALDKCSDWLSRFVFRENDDDKRRILGISADNFHVAAENYRLNTEAVLKLSEIYNFKVGITRLVNLADIERREYKIDGWNDVFFKNQYILSRHKNAFLVETIPSNSDVWSGATWFCDEIHQTFDGNDWIARKVHMGLNSHGWLLGERK